MGSKDVERLARKIDAALSREQVSFRELFTTTFMREHTRFSTFPAMCAAAGAKTAEELVAIPNDVWEKRVRAGTSFPSWEEMQKEAFAEWLKRQVDEP